MNHRKGVAMKRIVGLGAIVTLFGCALAGCSWDNPLYDAFVGTESKGGLVRCEGMKSLQLRPSAGDAQVVSIALAAECKSHAAELKTLGLSVATCEQSLVSEICPKNYSCYSGTCALMICNANEVFCDEHCVNPLTDSTFCGASGSCSALEDTRGTDCRAQETGQSCQNGECRCMVGMVYHEGKCRNPLNDPAYCGPKGITCDNGEVCDNGECRKNACEDPTQELCVVGGANACVRIFADEADHCGACNYRCAEHPMNHATANRCVDGKCQYECISAEYENCGTEENPLCLSQESMKSDPMHCGGCDKDPCNENEFCSDGECVQSACQNACHIPGESGGKECQNLDDKCGVQCIDCNTANNASKGTCSDLGVCTITECATGYRLENQELSRGSVPSCELNTAEACGSRNGQAPVLNCRAEGMDGICSQDEKGNPKCIATSCSAGKHLRDGECVPDSETECGNALTNCTALEGWANGTCENGRCMASECDEGYCSKDYTCMEGTSNAQACGVSGICETCADSLACIDGECRSNPCGANECYYQGETCSNTADHCGLSCSNCNVMNHADTGQCTSEGTCKITRCSKGYRLSNKYNCILNTNASCGSVTGGANTIKNCNSDGNATSGTCSQDSAGKPICTAIACKTGYHLLKGKCIQDSVTECGNALTNCLSLAGWGEGKCEAGVCIASACLDGFCLQNNKCMDGKSNSMACGKQGKTQTCEQCALGLACIDGSCQSNPCDANECYYKGEQCGNEDDHCGLSCIDCNTAAHAASGQCDKDTGKCTITKCALGYHLTTAGNCAVNSLESCGSTYQVYDVNCKPTGTENAVCSQDANGNPVCTAISCTAGYHLDGIGSCAKNDIDTCCGNACDNCSIANNAAVGTCNNGTCKVTKCAAGHHLNDTDTGCDANTLNICGLPTGHAVSCKNNPDTHIVSGICKGNGYCYAFTCETGYVRNSAKTKCVKN